ncbi:MAG: hypothetical protein CMO01_14590 [Thalassobius sp.]|nr:hypothetical protein [Thalassovita sp.]
MHNYIEDKLKLRFVAFGFIICLLAVSFTASQAQKLDIDYTLPENVKGVFKKKEYKFIIDQTINTISKRHKVVAVKNGAIVFNAEGDLANFNFYDLLYKCTDYGKKSEWETVIDDYVNSVLSSIEARNQIDLYNFETIKDRLAIRLYPEYTFARYDSLDQLIYRSDLEGVYSMLMLDLPETFSPIYKEMFEAWNVSEDDCFKIAQQNINKQDVHKEQYELETFTGDSIKMYFLANDDYAASYVLGLQNNSPELVGDWGSIVAIPNKGIVNLCPISKDNAFDFVPFIQRLIPVISQFHDQHPQPVSKDFYWYYKGEFTKVNLSQDEHGNTTVIAPYGLGELMTVQE